MKQDVNKSEILIPLLFFAVFVAVMAFFAIKMTQTSQINNQQPTENLQQPQVSTEQFQQPQAMENNNSLEQLRTVDPIDGALSRITKKPFGIYITPKTSPVQPERFQGYHTGTDLETMPEEQNIDVPVKSMCDGKLLMARYASGYGGVAVESCTLDGQAVTVVYGHIDLASVAPKVGAEMKAGDFLTNLGQGYSSQTDGERKHLHLGIHKGNGVNILGYVQSQSQLSGWIDAAKYLQ